MGELHLTIKVKKNGIWYPIPTVQGIQGEQGEVGPYAPFFNEFKEWTGTVEADTAYRVQFTENTTIALPTPANPNYEHFIRIYFTATSGINIDFGTDYVLTGMPPLIQPNRIYLAEYVWVPVHGWLLSVNYYGAF